MPRYVILLLIACVNLLVLYYLVIPASMSVKRKLLVMILSFGSALLMYFAARDIFGRADPWPLPGKYNIRFVEKNKKDGKIYVYVTGKRGDPNFEPRLMIIDPSQMNKGKSEANIGKMLDIGQEGQGQLQLELRRKNSWYDPSESSITIQDPLRDLLEPKEE